MKKTLAGGLVGLLLGAALSWYGTVEGADFADGKTLYENILVKD
jgi:hypothetical protein